MSLDLDLPPQFEPPEILILMNGQVELPRTRAQLVDGAQGQVAQHVVKHLQGQRGQGVDLRGHPVKVKVKSGLGFKEVRIFVMRDSIFSSMFTRRRMKLLGVCRMLTCFMTKNW